MVNSVPKLVEFNGFSVSKPRLFQNATLRNSKFGCRNILAAAQVPTPLRESAGAGNRRCMGIFKNIFTWWEGATFGTWLGTATKGKRVGHDAEGNVYYEGGKTVGGLPRRWVMYNGLNDASRVPPEWHGWLHHTFKEPPTRDPLVHKPWELPHEPNLTGTPAAYRPKGSVLGADQRPVVTGDYDAWTPGS